MTNYIIQPAPRPTCKRCSGDDTVAALNSGSLCLGFQVPEMHSSGLDVPVQYLVLLRYMSDTVVITGDC